MTWFDRAVPAAEVVAQIPSGAHVFVHGAAATPVPLLDALAARTDIEGVRLYHLHTAGTASFVAPSVGDRLRSVSFFVGHEVRRAVAEGRADFMPVFLSDIPALFRDGTIPLDAALVQCSPPDKHGFVTLGTSVDAARSAVDHARIVLAEINTRMPRTHGPSALHLDRIHAFTRTDRPLFQAARGAETEVEARIGELVAELIPDGACLQAGIGAIADCVLARLADRVDLGLHTEMFSDRILPLPLGGPVPDRHKAIPPRPPVTNFNRGLRKLIREAPTIYREKLALPLAA